MVVLFDSRQKTFACDDERHFVANHGASANDGVGLGHDRGRHFTFEQSPPRMNDVGGGRSDQLRRRYRAHEIRRCELLQCNPRGRLGRTRRRRVGRLGNGGRRSSRSGRSGGDEGPGDDRRKSSTQAQQRGGHARAMEIRDTAAADPLAAASAVRISRDFLGVGRFARRLSYVKAVVYVRDGSGILTHLGRDAGHDHTANQQE